MIANPPGRKVVPPQGTEKKTSLLIVATGCCQITISNFPKLVTELLL